MEEDEVLFPEDDEDGVPQLWQLGQGEQPRPEGGHLGAARGLLEVEWVCSDIPLYSALPWIRKPFLMEILVPYTKWFFKVCCNYKQINKKNITGLSHNPTVMW